MKKQVFNPYLPEWEYIPDGEPRVFGDRLYVFGSHDKFDGEHYCLNDYVGWSTPVSDLSDWRYEGVIYRAIQDSKVGNMKMFAPDVVQGIDGRYYLYYTLSGRDNVSVAVCDTPAGKYEFYGYVSHPDGTLCGDKPGDRSQFDPGVLVDDDGRVYLYTGFSHMKSMLEDMKRKGETPLPLCDGSFVTELEQDMKTVKTPTKPMLPGWVNSEGTGFEGHEFFEAPSMRKYNGIYYCVYSSIKTHELCYATSKYPDRDFKFQGVLHSNGDMFPLNIPKTAGLESSNIYIPKDPAPTTPGKNYWGNNHGSIVEINGEFYIFGHRQTNAHEFSRQAIAEKLKSDGKGGFLQSQMTSYGLNGKPLIGKGTYSAGIACNLVSASGAVNSHHNPDEKHPFITQDGKDYDPDTDKTPPPEQYIANMRNGSSATFKFFDCEEISKITIKVKSINDGNVVCMFRCADVDEEVATIVIPIKKSKIWTEFSADVSIPSGIYAIKFTYDGIKSMDFKSFTLE